MAGTKHTAVSPGPWTSQGWVPTWAYIPVLNAHNRIVCTLYPEVLQGYTREKVEANARLIAAAPDFYAAASKLLAAFDELQSTTTAERIITGRSDAELRRDSNEAIAELRAAKAKAEGSSHA